MANAENRPENNTYKYPLRLKLIAAGGAVAGLGIAAYGGVLSARDRDSASDYESYARAIDEVIKRSEDFETANGSQAVFLLEGVKEELKSNPKYQDSQDDGSASLAMAIGVGMMIGFPAVSVLDAKLERSKRRKTY